VRVSNDPQYVLVSDILLADCPIDFCSTKGNGGLQLRSLEPAMSIEATEQTSGQNFGPYDINKQQLKKGIWVEGTAYVYETEQGNCMLTPNAQHSKGDIPSLCEAKSARKTCAPDGSCTSASSSPEFYRVTIDNSQDRIAIFKSVTTQ